jgi:hypothetical protein
VAGAACFATGGTLGPVASRPPCHVSPAVRRPVAPIAAATPRALLAAVFAQIGPTGVRRTAITAPPRKFAGRAWLTFKLPAARPEYAYARWASLLAAAAYRDQARGNHLAEVAGTTFTGGSTLLGGRGRRGIASYRTLSAAALTCLVRRNAARVHGRVVALRMLQVEGMPVPVVTVSVPPTLAARSGGNWGLSYSLFDYPGAPSPYLGYSVTVEDEAGRWVQSLGQVPSAGGGWGEISTRYQSGRSCAGLPDCAAHG